MSIGENIKRIRLEKGLTQKQLGDLCSPPMADSAIRRYESGKANPKIGTLDKIAKALNVPISSIISANSFQHSSDIVALFTGKDAVMKQQYLSGFNKNLSETLPQLKQSNTLAAHFDGDEYTEEELDEIRQFAEYVKSKRKSTD